MKLIFKQRFFSWFDSYDIFDEAGNTVFSVKGQLAWGHCLKIFDSAGIELGRVEEKIFTLMPRFEIYRANAYLGSIRREFRFFKPVYNIDFNGWRVEGNFFEWNYSVLGAAGEQIATVDKQLWKLTDTYTIDVYNPANALLVLMLVLAIDAEKCSRD